MVEVIAKHKYARISAQKARLIADLIRGLPVAKALETLVFTPKKAAMLVRKVLESAIANAEFNVGADIDELNVAKIFVDNASTYKRWRARARGRGDRIIKPTCHITVIVSDKSEEQS